MSAEDVNRGRKRSEVAKKAAKTRAAMKHGREQFAARQAEPLKPPQQRDRGICAPRDHVWDEGDNDTIYCGVCDGYACDACAATGYIAGRKCFMCSGYGVVMWWEPERRWISPPNYLAQRSKSGG